MEPAIISYHDLLAPHRSQAAMKQLEVALLENGIVGIRDVPDFEKTTRAYIDAARAFTALSDATKQQYTPDRDGGHQEGYELGAEWFKDEQGQWQIDDKKASFYAFVPDKSANQWPSEVDLKTPYLALGELIFHTGKLALKALGLDEHVGLAHDQLVGYGRMLHYVKEGIETNANPNWCGAHLDHGILTGLVPAYYFCDGKETEEPEEAGLYITPTNKTHFEKILANDKSILFFQVGEFGQLASNDRIRATKHVVKKATNGIERYTFALFYSAHNDVVITSTSLLTQDSRYAANRQSDGSIRYADWEKASFDRYRAK